MVRPQVKEGGTRKLRKEKVMDGFLRQYPPSSRKTIFGFNQNRVMAHLQKMRLDLRRPLTEGEIRTEQERANLDQNDSVVLGHFLRIISDHKKRDSPVTFGGPVRGEVRAPRLVRRISSYKREVGRGLMVVR